MMCENDDVEYILLYDTSKPKNPDIPQFIYEHFNLDEMNDDKCKANLNFMEMTFTI